MTSRCGNCPASALLLVSALHIYAQKPGGAAPAKMFGPQKPITISIVTTETVQPAGPFASLDLGRVAWGGNESGAGIRRESTTGFTVVSTQFGLQIGCPASLPRPSVELRVSLSPVQSGVEVLVDGQPIGSASSVVSSYEPCATTNAHTLAVRFAKSVLPGQFHYNVDFTAIPR
jgi:hypothetical protein